MCFIFYEFCNSIFSVFCFDFDNTRLVELAECCHEFKKICGKKSSGGTTLTLNMPFTFHYKLYVQGVMNVQLTYMVPTTYCCNHQSIFKISYHNINPILHGRGFTEPPLVDDLS